MRAGTLVKQVEGYRAFIPAPLPPDPAVGMDSEMIRLLSEADRSLGRLDGVASVLPNPDLFVAMYVRQEAVLSSQIEGTQSTLVDVLQFEIDDQQDRPKDIREIVNYVDAMNFGLAVAELPALLTSNPGNPRSAIGRCKGKRKDPRRVPPVSELARSARLHHRRGLLRSATCPRDEFGPRQPGEILP
jgi:hypothetical protein